MSISLDTLDLSLPISQVEPAAHRFSVSFANHPADIIECQKLRYRIFAGEMGAAIDGGPDHLDTDEFDPYCKHLIVREQSSGRIIACTRILTDEMAAKTGGFYSSGEFDLKLIDALPGRVMEIGRTCVDAEYRSGAVIAVLWSGLADFVVTHHYDYLFGCASIGLEDGGANAHAILNQISEKYMAPSWHRVRPLNPLPVADARPTHKVRMPPLLKAYVSLGAKACGEAFWDREFNCADVFMLLNVSDLQPRYARHFLGRAQATNTVEQTIGTAGIQLKN
jgi:putative hemolysin